MRSLEDGTESPYELNCTYYSALSDLDNEQLGMARFLCSQAVALAMKGIPAIYFHSLCGTPNDLEGYKKTKRNRTVNRRKWQQSELETLLDQKETLPSQIFQWYLRTLRVRAGCPAFHPEAHQEIINLGASVFALRRDTVDGGLTVFCLFYFREITVKKMKEINDVFHQEKLVNY